MKRFPRWIVAFLIGELVVISRKDKSFKTKLKKQKWWDKLKFIANALFDFNKTLVDEAGDEIQKIDIDQRKKDLKARSEKRRIDLHILIKKAEKEIDTLSAENISAYIDGLQEKYDTTITKLKKLAVQAEEDFELSQKWIEIKDHIAKLRKMKK